jgi:hypothetical protein
MYDLIGKVFRNNLDEYAYIFVQNTVHVICKKSKYIYRLKKTDSLQNVISHLSRLSLENHYFPSHTKGIFPNQQLSKCMYILLTFLIN